MAESLIPVAFHGETLLAVVVNGTPHVSLKSIVEALGLDWAGQFQRIKRHAVLSAVVGVTPTTAADGKRYDTITIPLSMLNGWLFGVSAARVRPELRERLVQYQRECFDVLAAHFGARPAGAGGGAGAGTGDGTPGAADAGAPRALPAALPCIDVRTLLLTGNAEPGVPLPPELAALIDERAWAMAREAYDLARLHLQRRVAYHAEAGRAGARRLLMPEALHAVQQATLGHALAHRHHDELARLQLTAEALGLGAHRLSRNLAQEMHA